MTLNSGPWSSHHPATVEFQAHRSPSSPGNTRTQEAQRRKQPGPVRGQRGGSSQKLGTVPISEEALQGGSCTHLKVPLSGYCLHRFLRQNLSFLVIEAHVIHGSLSFLIVPSLGCLRKEGTARGQTCCLTNTSQGWILWLRCVYRTTAGMGVGVGRPPDPPSHPVQGKG